MVNLLKKLKSLFQKSEGADFKEPVKPGQEKVKRNVGKEVFEKTGRIKDKTTNSSAVKSKARKKTNAVKSSKNKENETSKNNRSAINKRVNVVKYQKKKVSVAKEIHSDQTKTKSAKNTKRKRD